MFVDTDFPSINSLKNKTQITPLGKGNKQINTFFFFHLIAKLLLYLKLLSGFKALCGCREALHFHGHCVSKAAATSATSPTVTGVHHADLGWNRARLRDLEEPPQSLHKKGNSPAQEEPGDQEDHHGL